MMIEQASINTANAVVSQNVTATPTILFKQLIEDDLRTAKATLMHHKRESLKEGLTLKIKLGFQEKVRQSEQRLRKLRLGIFEAEDALPSSDDYDAARATAQQFIQQFSIFKKTCRTLKMHYRL